MSMSAGYFHVDRATRLSAVTGGGRIHFIGVCGVAMAQAALMLSQRGYKVSGSDKEFYEPMGSLLSDSRVEICRGYRAENVSAEVELVVIGNALSYGHPEIRAVEDRGLNYTFFPKLLCELLIQGKHSIVISGTHGKTTTTALMAHALRQLGASPSYFVGGAVRGWQESLVKDSGKHSVVEGDEYDSCFFAKVPKFNFYHPDTLIVSSIEYDHADIYTDLHHVMRQFDSLVRSLNRSQTAICCIDDPNVRALLSELQGEVACRVVTYGESADSNAKILACASQGLAQSIKIKTISGKEFEFSLPLPGGYNAKNALAVVTVAEVLGFKAQDVAGSLASFPGVRRRQELKHDGAIGLIEDFAHHPTAVRETLAGIKAAFPGRRIWAVFEPRSNTSRRKVFQDDYVRAFSGVANVLLCQVSARSNDTQDNLLDVSELAQDISRSGPAASALPDSEAILERLQAECRPGDLIVSMSNGSFGGLVARLESWLKASSEVS